MRRQDPFRRSLTARLTLTVLPSAVLALVAPLAAQDLREQPALTGANPPMNANRAPPVPRVIIDDVRRMRNYPEQPPVIPHSIEGYQLTLNTNRCLSCHARQFAPNSGAPMISVTHFMDRDGQVLADVTPRRYFCTECHVPQSDVRPLVGNTFHDVLSSNPGSP